MNTLDDIDYDTVLEKMYHPENFKKMPVISEKDPRPMFMMRKCKGCGVMFKSRRKTSGYVEFHHGSCYRKSLSKDKYKSSFMYGKKNNL